MDIKDSQNIFIGLDGGASKTKGVLFDIEGVTLSTSIDRGTNLNVYKNGRELASRGVIELYDTIPETALVKMMWLAKHRSDNIEELMCTNLVGEISNSRKLE